jgi:hypothetical protein
MPDDNIKIIYKESYFKAIENSIGSRLFNSVMVEYGDSGKVVDLLNDGELSCAFFVSSILYLNKMFDAPHVTVKSVKEILSKSDKWREIYINDVDLGDVIFWEKIKHKDGTEHAHVGFALNSDESVSTSSNNKSITKHPLIHRPIDVIYRYNG